MVSNGRGCWSCRARRKRCDGKTPRCNTCDRLGIVCAGFGTTHPSWMDGGAKQRAYCCWLKNVVKSTRRQQTHTRRKSHSGSGSGLSQAHQSQEWIASRTSSVEVVVPETAPYQVQTLWTDARPSHSPLEADPRIDYLLTQPLDWETDTELFPHGLDEEDLGGLGFTMSQEYPDSWIAEAQQQYQPSPLSPEPDMPAFLALTQDNADYESDWLLLMRYFDCTMQRLFPFHCPVDLVDGRGYMLHLAHRSSMVRTALMSAVSYDIERVTTDTQPQDADSEACIATPRWLAYYHRGSAMILSELEALFNNKNKTSPSCRHDLAVEALVSLVHLLLLDLVANDKNTTTTRFNQGCQLLEFLDPTNSLQVSEPQSRVQAFFTSVFLRWLVFRRTVQPQEPRWSCLADALQRLLDNSLCGYATPLLEAISQIADLALWKTSSAAAGVLSMLELAKRAHAIEARVAPFVEMDRRQPFDNDEKTRSIDQQNGRAEPRLAPVHCYHRGCGCSFCNRAKATTTAAFTPTCPLHAYRQTLSNALLAHAAQVFLYIVVSGPNPCLLEIQAAVRCGVQLLRQWEKHKEIMGHMALSWPLAVMTSMAMGAEDREVLNAAVAACRGMWAYPNEQGQIKLGQALPLQFNGTLLA